MNSFAQGELLGQVMPDSTDPVTIYTATLRTEILLITAVVLDGNPNISVYHDDAGTTFDDAHQIYLRSAAAVDDPPFIFQARGAGGGIMVKPGGSIAVQTSVAEAVTFSVYGITAKLAERVRGNA